MARVTLRLPDDLHRRLRAASQKRGLSLNDLAIATLSHALAQGNADGEAEDRLFKQVQQIRSVLGGLAVELDANALPAELRPGGDLPDVDTIRQSIPELAPPLSVTIIADREDRF